MVKAAKGWFKRSTHGSKLSRGYFFVTLTNNPM